MAELTINQLIKLILGIIVVVAVVIGVYFVFKTNIIDFFSNLPGTEDGFSGCIQKRVEPVTGSYYYEDRGEEGIFYYEKKHDGWYYKFGQNKAEINRKPFVKMSDSSEGYINEVWRTCEKDRRNVILENG